VARVASTAKQGESALEAAPQNLPEEVEGYRVKAVCVVPRPPLPGGRRTICALVMSEEDEGPEDGQVLWNPVVGSAAQQAISALGDAFGVLGVWPAAWVAAERVLQLCNSRPRSLRLLEIGCGSGLPSLCALAAGCSVVATDLEELPLCLLEQSAVSQGLPGLLETRRVDMLEAAGSTRGGFGKVPEARRCPSDDERFDAIVCSDCLYKHDVADAIARILARALLRWPNTVVIVTDAERRGRQTFLDALSRGLGLGIDAKSKPPCFQAVSVPSWAADEAIDPFDGTQRDEVGLLRLF